MKCLLTKVRRSDIIAFAVDEAWLSLVERCVRDAEAAGSNPVASIPQKVPENKAFRHFFFWKQDMKKRFFGQKGAQKVHNLINTHHSCALLSSIFNSLFSSHIATITPLFLRCSFLFEKAKMICYNTVATR